MKLSRSLALVAALFVPAFTGCVADDETDVASESSDVEEGGQAACEYAGPANAKYKEAVAAAKTWTRSRCEVMQEEVYALAQEAVEMCPGVGPLIARSEWAGELRTALGPLEVAFLAGQLGPADDLDGAAVKTAIDQGLTLHANGQGVYGAPFKFHLRDGRYELESLVFDETGEEVPERVVTEVGNFGIDRAEDGGLVLWFEADEIEGEVPSSSFWILHRSSDGDDAYFAFEPMGAGDDEGEETEEANPFFDGWIFAVDVNECSA